MSHSANASVRRLPALLWLGLLALLLWGQCAVLFPDYPYEHNLIGWVKHPDSLRTTPPSLYITLHPRNNLGQPLAVQKVNGTLKFHGRKFPFSVAANSPNRTLAPGDTINQIVRVFLTSLSADSLKLLRTELAIPRWDDQAVSLYWQASYLLANSTKARRERTSSGTYSNLTVARPR